MSLYIGTITCNAAVMPPNLAPIAVRAAVLRDEQFCTNGICEAVSQSRRREVIQWSLCSLEVDPFFESSAFCQSRDLQLVIALSLNVSGEQERRRRGRLAARRQGDESKQSH